MLASVTKLDGFLALIFASRSASGLLQEEVQAGLQTLVIHAPKTVVYDAHCQWFLYVYKFHSKNKWLPCKLCALPLRTTYLTLRSNFLSFTCNLQSCCLTVNCRTAFIPVKPPSGVVTYWPSYYRKLIFSDTLIHPSNVAGWHCLHVGIVAPTCCNSGSPSLGTSV